MMLSTTKPWIVIRDAPVGYQVEIAPISDDYYDQWVDHREFAQAYARGLSTATGWDVEDRSTPDHAPWGCA